MNSSLADLESIALALDLSEVGVFVHSAADGRQWFSEAARRIWGLQRPDEPTREKIAAKIHPDDIGVLDQLNASVADDGPGVLDAEHRIIVEGAVRWVSLRATTLYEEGPTGRRAVRSVGVMRDITKERARQEETAEAHANAALLVALNDRLRDVDDPAVIQQYAVEAIGQHLRLSRVGYAEDVGDGDHVRVVAEFAQGVTSAQGLHRYRNFGAHILDDFMAGRAVVREDVVSDPDLSLRHKQAHAALHIQAEVNLPLVKEGRLVGVLFAQSAQPRRWKPSDIALLADVAQRTWDATQRAKAERALRASEARFRALFESMDDGFCIIQLVFDDNERATDYRFIAANAVYGRHTGLGNPVGKTARELVPDLEQFWFETWGRVATTGESVRFLRAVEAMDRWYELSAFRIDRPEDLRVAIWFRDVTEQHRTQDALQKSEARLRLATESGRVGIFETDLVSGRGQWSLEAVALLRSDRVEFTADDWLDGIHPEDRGRAAEAWRRALDLAEPYELECRTAQANDDGSVRWLLVRGRIERDAQGAPVTGTGVLLDISAAKSAQLALLEADRRKDTFLATLAHELRNPLAPIRTSLSILRHDVDAPGRAKLLDIMDRQVQHMVRMVDDLLEVSRITQGKIELKRDAAGLVAIVGSAIEAARPLLEQVGHRLEVDLCEGSVIVEGDEVRLTQVVANLLNNAIKYTEPGGTVRVSLSQRADHGVIEVCDSGIGIDAELLPRVFDLFTQGAPGRHGSQGGLGIGLALVQQIVELHGGEVTASSGGRGRGSTFRVVLPLIAAARPTTVSLPTLAGVGDDGLPPATVLIVDDNGDAADTLASLLKLAGNEVQTAYSGQEALDAFLLARPQIVLLDIGLPDLDGHEVARRMRAVDGADPVLIAVTGWGQQTDRELARASGFDMHLVKPVDPSGLTQIIASVRRGELARVDRTTRR